MLKYSSDGRVCFNSEDHTYVLDGEKKLISVTTLIGKFKNKFDSESHSKRMAERDGIDQQELLDAWSKKSERSCEIGTNVHAVCENYVLTGKIEKIDDGEKQDSVIKFINDFLVSERLIPVYTELIVYNDDVAGQVDLICKDKKGNHYILDFKTNDKINKYSYKKKMIGHFAHVNDASFYHYSIQLGIYKRLITEFEISGLFLIHIKQDGYEFIKCEDVLKDLTIKQLYNDSLKLN